MSDSSDDDYDREKFQVPEPKVIREEEKKTEANAPSEEIGLPAQGRPEEPVTLPKETEPLGYLDVLDYVGPIVGIRNGRPIGLDKKGNEIELTGFAYKTAQKAEGILHEADETVKRSSETRAEAKLSEPHAAMVALYYELQRLRDVEKKLQDALRNASQKAAATAFIDREYAELKALVLKGQLAPAQFEVLWHAALVVERRMDPQK